jgi:hypothetical protein
MSSVPKATDAWKWAFYFQNSPKHPKRSFEKTKKLKPRKLAKNNSEPLKPANFLKEKKM